MGAAGATEVVPSTGRALRTSLPHPESGCHEEQTISQLIAENKKHLCRIIRVLYSITRLCATTVCGICQAMWKSLENP
jgi:hypothetical protein